MTAVQTARAPVARPPIHPPSLLRASATIVWRNLLHIRRMWMRLRQTMVDEARSRDGGEIGGRVAGDRAVLSLRTAVTG